MNENAKSRKNMKINDRICALLAIEDFAPDALVVLDIDTIRAVKSEAEIKIPTPIGMKNNGYCTSIISLTLPCMKQNETGGPYVILPKEMAVIVSTSGIPHAIK